MPTSSVVVVLTLPGLAGLVGRFGARLGRVGAVGAALTVTGSSPPSGLAAVEAFAFPAPARGDPALLEFAGPILGSVAVRRSPAQSARWAVSRCRTAEMR
ncbi:MAG: hypothetical protein JWR45_1125 [Blastococcus sp.]|jgi:hypothetical protein|nr:hypothetical protein [Blastococcus sp.]